MQICPTHLLPCLTLDLSQHYGLSWWSLDPWLNWITLPRPLFSPLLGTLRLCPCQEGHCPCLSCPQYIFPKTFSEQNQKFLPTFFKEEETTRKSISVYLKAIQTPAQIKPLSNLFYFLSFIKLKSGSHRTFWCQGRVAHMLHWSLLQHGESSDTLAPRAEGNLLPVMSRMGCRPPAGQLQSSRAKGSGLATAPSQYIKSSQGYKEMPQLNHSTDRAAWTVNHAQQFVSH